MKWLYRATIRQTNAVLSKRNRTEVLDTIKKPLVRSPGVGETFHPWLRHRLHRHVAVERLDRRELANIPLAAGTATVTIRAASGNGYLHADALSLVRNG